MKRLMSSSSSDSLAGFMSICPNATEKEGNNPMYVKELQSMMMEGMEEEETGHVSEKKRRLSVEQVKALEKNFEVENKLEPERKVELAQDLGLQPRQVAVWFQNRRARWKTKQLERDYGGLKSTYDALKLDFDRLHHDNESLLKQIRELKSKLDGNGDVEEKTEADVGAGAGEAAGKSVDGGRKEEIWPKFGDLKDGCSDSDSSAILNEENNNNNNNNIGLMVKIEEDNFFGEESCSNLFSDDQAPSLHWYCNDQWN